MRTFAPLPVLAGGLAVTLIGPALRDFHHGLLTDEEFALKQTALKNQYERLVIGAWAEQGKAQRQASLIVDPPSGGRARLNVSVDRPDSPKAGEDCLYLNVWTAAGSPSERRPVMVRIFGGAYTEGAGSSPHNDD